MDRVDSEQSQMKDTGKLPVAAKADQRTMTGGDLSSKKDQQASSSTAVPKSARKEDNPFTDYQLKQLRAQCLVFLSLRSFS